MLLIGREEDLDEAVLEEEAEELDTSIEPEPIQMRAAVQVCHVFFFSL